MEERVRRVLAQHSIKPTPPDTDSDNTDELVAWIDAEDAHLIARAVAELDDAEQAATVLHYFEDLSLDEIAAALGVPRRTVASTLRRAWSDLDRNPELRYRSSQLRERWRRSQTSRGTADEGDEARLL